MILSMTGYGKAELQTEKHRVSIEIKTLNSKFFECSIKSNRTLGKDEMNIRQILSKRLKRGTLRVNIEISSMDVSESELETVVNLAVVNQHYKALKQIEEEFHLNSGNELSQILELPNSLIFLEKPLSEELQTLLYDTLGKTIEKLDETREAEGETLYDHLKTECKNIRKNADKVVDHEADREIIIRERLTKKLDELLDDGKVKELDKGRFEQEILYYIDRLDINEEKIRLQSHLDHFIEILDAEESSGKKLAFISQEIGREVNTLGNKSNHLPIQKLVINMKESLGQIKEQLFNVL